MTFEKTTKTCFCFLKIKMVSYHTIVDKKWNAALESRKMKYTPRRLIELIMCMKKLRASD